MALTSLPAIVWLSLTLACALWTASAAEKAPKKEKSGGNDKKKAPMEDIFSQPQVFRLKIEVSKEGMTKLRKQNWGFRDMQSQKERPVVQATVYEGDKIYTNVALHLKGAAGSFRPVDDQPAFTLNFDKFAKGQSFHGRDKISLNNSVQDPSYLSEKLCRELFIEAGVPAPRAGHAKVNFNGRDLGMYVLVEGWGKDFLRQHYKNVSGNLYDGGFVREINDEPPLDVNSGDNPKDYSALQRVIDAAMVPDRTNRYARLEKVLDMNRFITSVAMDAMLCHWDGYAMNRNNYRVFHDVEQDKMIFMPHGLDQTFGSGGHRGNPNDSIMPPMNGLVARAVIQTPEGRRQYMQRMSQLMTNIFQVEALTNRVRTIAAAIRPAFAENGEGMAKSFDYETRQLCSRIEQRCRSLRQQLASPAELLTFDAAGVAKLKGWKSKGDFGKPVFEEVKEASGKKLMRIDLNASGVGSWRASMALESGKYRLEGRVKTQGVVPDPGDTRAGAGLRLSTRRLTQKILADTDWTNLAFDFEITEGMGNFEAMCELRAGKGTAWFDVDSIRLIRKWP